MRVPHYVNKKVWIFESGGQGGGSFYKSWGDESIELGLSLARYGIENNLQNKTLRIEIYINNNNNTLTICMQKHLIIRKMLFYVLDDRHGKTESKFKFNPSHPNPRWREKIS